MSGGGGGGGGLFNNPLELALVAGTAIAAPYAAPALFGEGAALGGLGIAGDSALASGLTGAGIGALGGAVAGYNPVQTGLMGGLGGAAAGAMGVGGAGAGATGNMANAGLESGMAGTAMSNPAATAATTSLIPGISNTALGVGAGGVGLAALMANEQKKYGVPSPQSVTYTGGNLAKFKYDPNQYTPDVVTPPNPVYQAQYAQGGLTAGGPANVDFMGGDMYPQSQQQRSYYATPTQAPTSAQEVGSLYEPKTNPLTGEEVAQMADGGSVSYDPNAELQQQAMLARLSGLPSLTPTASAAGGKIESLGSYSDGGQMLKGPGDGMSDSIPAKIGANQPARLADNEFVVPADVVSHLGNGSSDAGAKKLYSMMDKVRKARTGKKAQAPKINADKYMPA
jgi:hypothetical protein